MKKLLKSYAALQNTALASADGTSLRNLAIKIVAYERKHPFSTMGLTAIEENLLDRAKQNIKFCNKRAEKMQNFEFDYLMGNIQD